jgi:hypothetical protein
MFVGVDEDLPFVAGVVVGAPVELFSELGAKSEGPTVVGVVWVEEVAGWGVGCSLLAKTFWQE